MARRTETMDGILVAERCLYTSLETVGVGATDSTYTEAGPRPGLPVYSDDRSVLQLVVSQAQAESLTFEVRHSGQPSRDGLQMQYRPTDETVSYGWETPSMITAWHPTGNADWGNQDASSSAICVVPSAQYVIAAVYDTTTTEVVVTAFAPSEDSPVTVQTGLALDASWGDGIALAPLPDERVLLFLGRKVYYSDDLGTNWALYSEGITTETVTTYGRTTVVQYRGDLLMLVEDDTTANTVHHLASTDGGASFALVATYTALGRRIDACANEDGIHITWTLSTSTSTRYRRLAHVHEELDQTTATVISNGGSSSFIASDGGGTLWIGWHSTTTTGRMFLVSSVDSGETWTQHDAGCYYTDNASDEAIYLHAVWQCGRIALLHGYDDGGTPYTGAGVMWLGGWSSACGAVDDDHQHDPVHRPGWTSRTGTSNSDGGSYLPWTSPANEGWTGSGGAGTPSISTEGSLSLVTAANEISYSQAPANMSGSVLFRTRLRVVSGGSLVTQAIAFVARIANGVYDYEISLQFTTTGFTVVDVNGGGASLATITRTMTAFTDIMGWLDNAGGCKIAYRNPGARLWTTVYSGTGVTNDGATPNANGILRWGNIATATASSRWREVHWTIGTGTELPRLALVAATSWGKPINARPEPLPEVDDSGLVSYLSVTAGPGRYGESVVVAPAYEYSIRHACAEEVPSPRTKWRSTSTAEQSTVFDLGANGHTGQAVGLFVTGANFRTIYLENYVGGAWQTRATLDLATGLTGLTPTLSGDVVYPNTASTSPASRWLWEQELRGGWVKGTAGASAGARITSQSSGGWSQTGSVIPVLTVSDGTLLTGTTGCALVAHAGLVVWYPSAIATTIARYWRWRIPAGTGGDDTPDGETYYEAGAIILGRVQPFGAAWSWGRSADAEPRVDRFVDASGAARQRKRGPVARKWTAGWSDHQDHLPIRSSLACDYVGGASAFGLAAHNDVSQLLTGLLEMADGGARPMVAITNLPADGVTVTDRTRYLYGHLTSDVRATQPLGSDVGSDDTWLTGEITISEAV